MTDCIAVTKSQRRMTPRQAQLLPIEVGDSFGVHGPNHSHMLLVLEVLELFQCDGTVSQPFIKVTRIPKASAGSLGASYYLEGSVCHIQATQDQIQELRSRYSDMSMLYTTSHCTDDLLRCPMSGLLEDYYYQNDLLEHNPSGDWVREYIDKRKCTNERCLDGWVHTPRISTANGSQHDDELQPNYSVCVTCIGRDLHESHEIFLNDWCHGRIADYNDLTDWFQRVNIRRIEVGYGAVRVNYQDWIYQSFDHEGEEGEEDDGSEEEEEGSLDQVPGPNYDAVDDNPLHRIPRRAIDDSAPTTPEPVRYNARKHSHLKSLGSSCRICLETYTPIDDIFLTRCFHAYHSECIKTWFGVSSTCPMCRERLPRGEELVKWQRFIKANYTFLLIYMTDEEKYKLANESGVSDE